MSNTHKHEANTVDEILDRITQDGRYSSAKEFSILFVESQDTLSGLSPIQFRKAKAKQQIQALITEARIDELEQTTDCYSKNDNGVGVFKHLRLRELNWQLKENK